MVYPLIKNVDETLDRIINDKCSVSRYGDGEFHMMMMIGNIPFQTAIDIGHIDIEYEWFLQGVTEVSVVKNKFVNECGGGANVGDIHDIKYENEIISKIF